MNMTVDPITNPVDRQQTILIVDDNPTNLRLISMYLQQRGFELLTARDGTSALQRAQYVHPDLILLDVMMPGIDGFETCRRLQAQATTQDIPVIFMTALTDTENTVKGFQVGAVDYVTKPLQLEEVLARVTTHLRLRELTQSLQAQNVQLQETMSALQDANGMLSKRALQLETSNLVGRQVTALLDLEALLEAVVEVIQAQFDHYFVGVWLVHESHGTVVLQAGIGRVEGAGIKPGLSLPLEPVQSIIAWVCQTRQTYETNQARAEARYGAVGVLSETGSQVAVPLVVGDRVVGVLDVHADEVNHFTPEDVSLHTTLAAQVAVVIRNAQLYRMAQEEVAERTRAEEDLRRAYAQTEQLQKDLLDKAHKSGMAEIATGVLHNVGNVLNSINISASLAEEKLQNSGLYKFIKANELLRSHSNNTINFMLTEKGEKLLKYYIILEDILIKEHNYLTDELSKLVGNIDIIKNIISTQQNYAGVGFLTEHLTLEKITEEFLILQSSSMRKHGIDIRKNFHEVPEVAIHKSKFMHILMNMFKNARETMQEIDQEKQVVIIDINRDNTHAYLKISDNGAGIAEENLTKIFTHGFTTKAAGHGFGLHSCANYMTEMGGKMWAESQGEGKGTTFVLSFPLNGST